MKYGPFFVKNKNGQEIELRNAEIADAENLIAYLKKTSEETPYLIREPQEITIIPEQEEEFIQQIIDSPKELMLLAFVNGKHAGNCSLMNMGGYHRYAHRCSVAIALYKDYCGEGIGKLMMESVLHVAKEFGYEQAELEVMSKNDIAVALYKKLGFKIYGTLPNNMKYKDGSYDDAYWMMKKL